MKKYIGYRKQSIECDKNGNRFLVKAPYSSQEILVCVKHKTYCHSKACLEERTGMTKTQLKILAKRGQKKLKQIMKKVKSFSK